MNSILVMLAKALIDKINKDYENDVLQEENSVSLIKGGFKFNLTIKIEEVEEEV